MTHCYYGHCFFPPGFSVLHHLLEFVQTHVHWVSDAIQPSLSSVAPFSFCPQSFPVSGSFPLSPLFASDDQSIGVSASVSVPPMNMQSWFPLGLTGLICCPEDSQEFSPPSQFKGISSLALCLLYSPALTTAHDHLEDHSLDYMDLCQQSNVSDFQHAV